MNAFDLYATATSLSTPIAACMDSGDFVKASELAAIGMDAADQLLCDIEDGFAPLYVKREQEIAALWDRLWTAKIQADNAAR